MSCRDASELDRAFFRVGTFSSWYMDLLAAVTRLSRGSKPADAPNLGYMRLNNPQQGAVRSPAKKKIAFEPSPVSRFRKTIMHNWKQRNTPNNDQQSLFHGTGNSKPNVQFTNRIQPSSNRLPYISHTVKVAF